MSLHQSIKCHRLFHILILITLVFSVNTAAGALNYTVVPSDTLYGLSRRYEIPLNWIIRANSLANVNIQPGQNLEIPVNGINTLEVRPGGRIPSEA